MDKLDNQLKEFMSKAKTEEPKAEAAPAEVKKQESASKRTVVQAS